MVFLLILLGFFCGSLMFSYWLGRLLKRNIKKVGDGNPGAINLWKTMGAKFGLLGVLLDFLKGYLPLFIIIRGGYVSGFEMVPIAVAPILGHAFTPFLGFKGGKAIATTFGVWSALTSFEVSIAYAIILAFLSLIARMGRKEKPISAESDSLQVVLGMLFLSIYLYTRHFSLVIFGVWFLNLLILIYKNKKELIKFINRSVN